MSTVITNTKDHYLTKQAGEYILHKKLLHEPRERENVSNQVITSDQPYTKSFAVMSTKNEKGSYSQIFFRGKSF